MFYLYLGIAGAIGASLRYSLGQFVHWWVHGFPLGTLLINLSGSFALSWLNQQLHWPSAWRTVIGSGLIGSFTTFSTFSVETIKLLIQGQWLVSFTYSSLSLIGGLFFAYLGYRFAQRRPAE